MKKAIHNALCCLAVCLRPIAAAAHCVIPCGICDDATGIVLPRGLVERFEKLYID